MFRAPEQEILYNKHVISVVFSDGTLRYRFSLFTVEIDGKKRRSVSCSTDLGTRLISTYLTTSNAITSLFTLQWAIKIRGDTRRAQAIPQIVELLRIDYDPTIRAAAIALRNLCVDSENKRTVGKAVL